VGGEVVQACCGDECRRGSLAVPRLEEWVVEETRKMATLPRQKRRARGRPRQEMKGVVPPRQGQEARASPRQGALVLSRQREFAGELSGQRVEWLLVGGAGRGSGAEDQRMEKFCCVGYG
jgi:hypothetical protein